MIKEFVNKFIAREQLTKSEITDHIGDYDEIVKRVIQIVTSEERWGDFNIDPERIHKIDDGDYQGTLVYVIAEKGYQPSKYWYVTIGYGSCGGCDTLAAINEARTITKDDVNSYYTLMLHVVQGLKRMGDSDE